MSAILLDWEVQFWNTVAKSDGLNCPIYSGCQARVTNGWCPTEEKTQINKLIDRNIFNQNEYDFVRSGEYGQVLQGIEHLADEFLYEGKVQEPPVLCSIIKKLDEKKPINVRFLPLKMVHGALWDQHNEWVIHLKKDDPLDQKRYTMFHEVFHIIERNTVQRNRREKHMMRGGLFYEILADHFATSVLMPVRWVVEKWELLQDIDRLAQVFRVPKQVAFIRLRRLALI